jgi:hypothetical protein
MQREKLLLLKRASDAAAAGHAVTCMDVFNNRIAFESRSEITTIVRSKTLKSGRVVLTERTVVA